MSELNNVPAPALARGLNVLEILNKADDTLTLDQLAQELSYPKASLLRLLETLSVMGLVRRDEAGKTYTALAGVVHHDRRSFVRSVVRREMERLTMATGITSEWYEAGADHMRLVDLFDPPEAHVHIAARIGFRRRVNDESEAVTRIALASPLFKHSGVTLWQYTVDGEKTKLSSAECAKQVAEAQEAGITMDPNWNGRGIRRYAVAVMDDDALMGILALAEIFTPSANKRIDANLNELKQSAQAIAQRIK